MQDRTIKFAKSTTLNTASIRKELHQYIDQIDDRLVKLIYGMIKTDINKEMVVGYTSDGKAITQSMYVEQIKEAREQVKERKTITHEELEKLSENW